MGAFAFALVFGIVALLAYMGRYSGRVRLERTRLIQAPLAEVYARVADLRQWQDWCPWLTGVDTPPSLSASSDAPGSRLRWHAARSGSATVEHLRLRPGQQIDQQLQAELPFAYQGRMQWRFEERAGQTLVHWRLRARVSFSLRFVASTVRGALDFDYRQALDQLASLLEPADAPRYRIEPLGLCEVPACSYAYRRYDGAIRGLPAARQAALAELRQVLNAAGVSTSEAPLALYLQTNTQRQHTVCLVAVPIQPPGPERLTVRELPAQQTYAVRLRGSLENLDLAWYQAMRQLLLDDLQADQRLPPFERYVVQAADPQANDNVTELHIPVRGPGLGAASDAALPQTLGRPA